eukprot:scaffold89931_cov57-Phaeocystis_antarctica.AAC.1
MYRVAQHSATYHAMHHATHKVARRAMHHGPCHAPCHAACHAPRHALCNALRRALCAMLRLRRLELPPQPLLLVAQMLRVRSGRRLRPRPGLRRGRRRRAALGSRWPSLQLSCRRHDVGTEAGELPSLHLAMLLERPARLRCVRSGRQRFRLERAILLLKQREVQGLRLAGRRGECSGQSAHR